MTHNVYSVSQVNRHIKDLMASDYMLRNIYIKGEISNCKYHSSGHIYFTIKDGTSTLNAIMFRSSAVKMSFRMKEGDKVTVCGYIDVYERDGAYQLYAREIESDGMGKLYEKFLMLKASLDEMGMFDPSYKRAIPRYSKRIGIVTAPTGAAVRDIRTVSYRRNPYVELILYPALVQGAGAAETIVAGIKALDQLELDVIIVGRGGGSLEDLWAFNEEKVAKAIFNAQTPIISAVGHETDTTISDFVADLRAATPSAAAELAVCSIDELQHNIYSLYHILSRTMKEQVAHKKMDVERLEHQLKQNHPKVKLEAYNRQVKKYEETLEQLLFGRIQDARHKVLLLNSKLDGNSPTKKLQQGYSFVTDAYGHNIHLIEQVEVDQLVKIHMSNGKVYANVHHMDKGGLQ